MNLTISGIKCDFKLCDYRDDSVEFKDFESYIHKPCPKCGTILLTQDEYNLCLKLQKRVSFFSKVFSVLKYLNPFFYLNKLFKSSDTEDIIISTEYPDAWVSRKRKKN